MIALLGLLRNPWLLLVIACVAGMAGTGWYRMKWEGEKAAYAGFREKEAKAVLAAQAKAEALSNELIIAQAASMAVTERTVVSYVDKIIHDTPSACPPSSAARDGSRAVRDLLSSPGFTPPK